MIASRDMIVGLSIGQHTKRAASAEAKGITKPRTSLDMGRHPGNMRGRRLLQTMLAAIFLASSLPPMAAHAHGRKRDDVQPPTASFTISPRYPVLGQPAAFVATATPSVGNSDEHHDCKTQGKIVSYVWDFGDGTTGTGQQVQHTYTAAADAISIRLVVTDVRIKDGDKIVTVIVVTDVLKILPPEVQNQPKADPTRFNIRISPFTGRFEVIDE